MGDVGDKVVCKEMGREKDQLGVVEGGNGKVVREVSLVWFGVRGDIGYGEVRERGQRKGPLGRMMLGVQRSEGRSACGS